MKIMYGDVESEIVMYQGHNIFLYGNEHLVWAPAVGLYFIFVCVCVCVFLCVDPRHVERRVT